MSQMHDTLYHGTIYELSKVDVSRGRNYKDFGKGFYMALSKTQAIGMMHKKYREATKRMRNDKPEGKGIYYAHNGDRYEGDYKNNKKEGKGIAYFHNGDRAMGDFYNDKPIGKHVKLTKNGEVQINNY